jgi:phage terminase small subunit
MRRKHQPHRPLNARQKLFIEEYLKDLNGTQAAIRAGYSRNSASEQACELLRKPTIVKELAPRQERRLGRLEVTRDRVLRELALNAFADIRSCFDAHGQLVAPQDLTDEAAAAIGSLEVVTKQSGKGPVEYINKVKLNNKIQALEILARHLRLLTVLVEVDTSQPLVAFPAGTYIDVGKPIPALPDVTVKALEEGKKP